ncbi:MAG: twin-arginine translocation pathway signal protein [Draconibacterium sp.]|nr:twin-arginine translocation pathway signal protein [Draconibacterium sp.]
MKKLLGIFILLLTGLLFVQAADFKMKKPQTNRIWLGADYWANRIQDWQISDGKIKCVASNWNRNISLLTYRMGEETGSLQMSAEVQVLNETASTRNWVGFKLAAKGKFNDYRDDAIYGTGLNIGITTNGELFIGETPVKYVKNAEGVKPYLKEGIILKVTAIPAGENYNIEVTVTRKTNNELLASEKLDDVPGKSFFGAVGLVSDFNEVTDKQMPSVVFANWQASGTKLIHYSERAFGPVLFTQYTLSRGTLKMSAQMPPMGKDDDQVATLQINENGTWKNVAQAPIERNARTAIFRVENWDGTQIMPYRVSYKMVAEGNKKEEFFYDGEIRKEPFDKDKITVAAFTGNNDLGYPNNDLWGNVKKQNPDILFFSGDQIYERVAGYGLQRAPVNMAILDYLRKWYIYGWAYGDLLRKTPSVSIPDDHDVFHGNVWGNGGKAAIKTGSAKDQQDSGGYKMPAIFVNVVDRTQTGHLPDPYDPTSIKQGIGVYYTELNYGGISFAIIEDRKFKSAPKSLLPQADISNGWAQNSEFDAANDAFHPDAKLLGDRQLEFLENWIAKWDNKAEMKTLLSATIFNNVATLPTTAKSDDVVPKLEVFSQTGYAPNDVMVSDFDSNAWPQTGRNNALKIIRKGFAFHIAGDQHLGSSIQYGTDEFGDAGFAICVPSISNIWPRRFYPQKEGGNHKQGDPKYTGDFEDGFGNKMTVLAISNPFKSGKEPASLYDRATGYGIITFDKSARTITFANWSRFADPTKGEKPYKGWPITVSQEDNYGRKAVAYLPQLKIKGMVNPVIEVTNEKNSEIIYSIRIKGNSWQPKVFEKGSYTVKVGDPDLNKWETIEHIQSATKHKKSLEVSF